MAKLNSSMVDQSQPWFITLSNICQYNQRCDTLIMWCSALTKVNPYFRQAIIKQWWQKLVMVHYIGKYMLAQPNMWHINNVTFVVHQGLCCIVMFINSCVALQCSSTVMSHCELFKSYVALQNWLRVMSHWNNSQYVTH